MTSLTPIDLLEIAYEEERLNRDEMVAAQIGEGLLLQIGQGEIIPAPGLYASVTNDGNGLRVIRNDQEQLVTNAMILRDAIARLFVQQRNIGQAILHGLWEFRRNGYIIYMGENGEEYGPEDFPRWAYEQYGSICGNETYLNQLIMVITDVLSVVDDAVKAGDPFMTPDGIKITAEYLLEKYGVIGKLIMVGTLLKRVTRDQQDDLMNEVTNGTQESLKGKKAEMEGTEVTIHLPYRIIDLPDADGNVRVVMDLNRQQLAFLLKLLGNAGEAILQ